MGCHTWFYRKIDRTQEQAKQSCLNLLRKLEEFNTSVLHDKNYKGRNLDTLTDDVLLSRIAILQRQIRMVENNLCQKAVWNYQDDDDLTEYIEGKGLYIEDTEFHDVFRKDGYPEDRLFSLEETLNYINNPKNNCTIYENTVEKLNEFWNKYPDGFIEFG